MKHPTVLVLAGLLLAAAPAQQFNRATASMVINGVDGPLYPMTIGVRTTTFATIVWSGVPGFPFVFVKSGNGNLQAGAGTYNGDFADIPLSPAYVILADGNLDPAIAIGPTGSFTLPVTIPDVGGPPNGIAVGYHDAFQSLVFDPAAPGGFHITAATRVNITQGPMVTNITLGDESATTVALPSGMTVPFFGASYTTLTITSNGFINLGSNQANDFVPNFTSAEAGPPRIFGFWSDLDEIWWSWERYLIDASPPSGVPTFRAEFTNVVDSGSGRTGGGFLHTFAMQIDVQGNIEISHGFTCAESMYSTVVGITSGGSDTTPGKDFVGILNGPGQYFGASNETFLDWYGEIGVTAGYTPNPPVSHTYNLAGLTLHFQPIGPGTVQQSTNQYWFH